MKAIYFTKPWCGLCQKMKPTILELIDEGYPIEITDDDNAMTFFDVSAIPCLLVIKADGSDIRIVGMTSKQRIQETFDVNGIYLR